MDKTRLYKSKQTMLAIFKLLCPKDLAFPSIKYKHTNFFLSKMKVMLTGKEKMYSTVIS